MYRILPLLTCLLIGGCTHVHTVRSSDETTLQELNERGRERTARVTLHDGTRFPAEHVRVSADSVSWRNLQTDERDRVSLHDIEAIEFRSRERGALEGAGLGVTIGAAVGAAVGLVVLAVTDDPGAGLLVPPAAFVFVPAVWGSGVGTFVGVWAGLDRGSTDIYRPAQAEEADSP